MLQLRLLHGRLVHNHVPRLHQGVGVVRPRGEHTALKHHVWLRKALLAAVKVVQQAQKAFLPHRVEACPAKEDAKVERAV